VTLHVGRLPTLVADPQQLYRAVVALVRRTAGDHLPGTVLTVGALHRDREWQIRIGPAPSEVGHLECRSPGPDTVEATDGVKLLTAQRAVEAHGGRVWFTRDRGTTVWFTIPDRASLPRRPSTGRPP